MKTLAIGCLLIVLFFLCIAQVRTVASGQTFNLNCVIKNQFKEELKKWLNRNIRR